MAHIGTLFRVTAAVALILVPFLFAKVSGAMENSRNILIETGTSAASLNQKIATAPKGSIVTLLGGSHTFDAPIKILRDGITLQGRGADVTRIIFDFAPTTFTDFLSIVGGKKSRGVKLGSVEQKGSTQVTTNKPLSLIAGDAVYIQTPNTREWLAQNGWSNVRWDEAAKRPFRESIHRVVSVSGTKIILETELPFATTSKTTLHKINLLTNVAVKNLSVLSALGEADAMSFENTKEAWNGGAAINAYRTDGLVIENIEILNSPSSAFILASSVNAKVDTLVIDGTHNKGGGGNGYGVELHEAFDNKLRNLTINNMRHAVIFSAWHAEISNDIHVAQTNRDINFHGSLDHSNKVVVDEIALQYGSDRSPSKRRNVWKVLSAGGTNHAETDFLAVNDVQLSQAAGSWRDDVLVASNDAKLTGGFGKDRFVVEHGKVTVVDFETGDAGDVLELPKNAQPNISQQGSDVLIEVFESRIVLQNCRAGDLTQANFAQPVPTV